MVFQPLPLRRFTLTSPLAPAEVTALLSARIAGRVSPAEQASYLVEALFREASGEPIPVWFHGTVLDGSFLLQRLGSSATATGPALRGQVHREGTGSRLAVTAGIEWPFAALLLAWPMVVILSDSWWQISTPRPWLILMAISPPSVAFLVSWFAVPSVRQALQSIVSPAKPSAA